MYKREDYLLDFILLKHSPLRFFRVGTCRLFLKISLLMLLHFFSFSFFASLLSVTSFSKLSLIALYSWSKYLRSFLCSLPAGSVFHISKADTSLLLKDSVSSSSQKSGTENLKELSATGPIKAGLRFFFHGWPHFFLSLSFPGAFKSAFSLSFIYIQ